MPELDVRGVKLSYEVRGEGPSVLLICGTQQQASTWWFFAGEALVDAGHTVIVFDNRGGPPSDVPDPPYTIEEMAEDAIGVAEHLGVGPYLVVGTSLGGLIAQTVALQRPDLCRAVAFLQGCGNLSAYVRAQFRAQIDLMKTGIDLPPSYFAWANLATAHLPTQLQDNTVVESALAMAAQRGSPPRAGILGKMEALLKWSTEDHVTELKDLRMPALAIANDADLVFPTAYVQEAIATTPQGRFVGISDAPHVALHKLEEITTHVLEFAANHASARA